jgi:hypothetical protein
MPPITNEKSPAKATPIRATQIIQISPFFLS